MKEWFKKFSLGMVTLGLTAAVGLGIAYMLHVAGVYLFIALVACGFGWFIYKLAMDIGAGMLSDLRVYRHSKVNRK